MLRAYVTLQSLSGDSSCFNLCILVSASEYLYQSQFPYPLLLQFVDCVNPGPEIFVHDSVFITEPWDSNRIHHSSEEASSFWGWDLNHFPFE